MSSRSRGFTLVELLTVIAIISVLASMLMPVYSRAREQARAAACLSNTRQIASGMLLYSGDYDEAIIPWRSARDSDPLPVQIASCWTTTIQPYLKSSQILTCPSYNAQKTARAIDEPDCDGNGRPGSGSSGFVPPAQYLSHYGIAIYLVFGTCTQSDPYAHFAGAGWRNAYYPGLGGSGAPVFQMAELPAIAMPARTAYIGDGLTVARADAPVVGTLFGCEGRYRHKDSGANLTFLDGHSRYLPGDPERYMEQDPAGCWFEEYFTADR